MKYAFSFIFLIATTFAHPEALFTQTITFDYLEAPIVADMITGIMATDNPQEVPFTLVIDSENTLTIQGSRNECLALIKLLKQLDTEIIISIDNYDEKDNRIPCS